MAEEERRSNRDGEQRDGARRGGGDGKRRDGSRPRRDGDSRPQRDGERRRPRREGDFKPRRDGGSRPRRDGERTPRRDDDSRPRREGDFKPRRDGTGKPRRESDYRPRRDGDSRPRRDGDFRPRRDGGSRPRRDGEQRPRRDGERRRGNDNDFRQKRDGDSRDGRGGDRRIHSDRGGRDRREHDGPDLRPVRDEFKAPDLPDDCQAEELDMVARIQLKTLEKDNAERVARHLAMTARLIDEEPELAHQHAIAASRTGGRIGVVRETLGITAYTIGDFALALREFRTFRRLTGSDDQSPLMVDSERGLGRPEKALEFARSVDAAKLEPGVRAELAIAKSGARLDLGQAQAALEELRIPELDRNKAFDYSPALFAAYANVLEELGRGDEAAEWYALSDRAVDALHNAYLAEGTESVAVEEEFISVPRGEQDDAHPSLESDRFAPAEHATSEQDAAGRGETGAEEEAGAAEDDGSADDGSAGDDIRTAESAAPATESESTTVEEMPSAGATAEAQAPPSDDDVALFDFEEDR